MARKKYSEWYKEYRSDSSNFDKYKDVTDYIYRNTYGDKYDHYVSHGGASKVNEWTPLRSGAGAGRDNNLTDEYMNKFYDEYDKFSKGFKDYQGEDLKGSSGTIQAQSTIQGGPNSGVGLEGSTETDKDTEMTKRKSKSKGNRGFRISREQGQGLNI